MEEVLPSAPPMMAELFGLTVRTLSGTEYKLANVQMHYTVADLKEMICDVAPNFPVKQQKLIKGSSTLVDTATMGELGLKNGDTIHLVKTLDDDDDDDLDGETPAPSVNIASPQNPGEPSIITVLCPENAGPGTKLMINPPGREQMTVTVPAGVAPGSRFQVRLPAAQSQQPVSQQPASQQPARQQPAGQIMQVTCPPNTSAGQEIMIEVAGVGRMKVRVPDGVRSGQTFRFRLPASS